jgi:hypothetical protein
MVDIHSMAASPHPSHRVQETDIEVTSHSQAGRSQRASTLWPRQPQLLLSTSARPGRSGHRRQRRVSRPHWLLLAGRSTTHRWCTPPHQPQSSGATMSISSSSRPTTPHITRKGGRSRWQHIRAPPRLHAHRHLLTCLIRHAYCRAL